MMTLLHTGEQAPSQLTVTYYNTNILNLYRHGTESPRNTLSLWALHHLLCLAKNEGSPYDRELHIHFFRRLKEYNCLDENGKIPEQCEPIIRASIVFEYEDRTISVRDPRAKA